MKLNNKILLILPFLLSACSFHSGDKSKESNTKSVTNITFSTTDLPNNYFKYVDISKLANIPPIDKNLSDYLFSQIAGKENSVRPAVEAKEQFTDKMKRSLCSDLPQSLCDFNSHMYSGSKFGLKLYEQTSKKEISQNTIVMAPLGLWSVDWLHSAQDEGKKLAETCSTVDNECLNKNASNPVSKLIAICSVKSKENIEGCLAQVLGNDESKNFAFDIGYVTGYNISYNIGQ